MEQIATDGVGRPGWLAYAANTSAVAPVRPTQITQASLATSGQDSRGGDSQGRGQDESDAYRPSTFQAVLLSSTTLSNLQAVLARLSVGQTVSVVDKGSLAYQQAAAQQASPSVSPPASGDGKGDAEDASAETGAAPSETSGGTGYYGYDWFGSGQTLEAARKATAAYMQSLNATLAPADRPYAQKAELLDLVA